MSQSYIQIKLQEFDNLFTKGEHYMDDKHKCRDIWVKKHEAEELFESSLKEMLVKVRGITLPEKEVGEASEFDKGVQKGWNLYREQFLSELDSLEGNKHD